MKSKLPLVVAAGGALLCIAASLNAQAPSGLTAAKCVQAQKLATDAYEQAKKNKKLYATDAEAKAAARRIFARRIKQELNQAGPVTEDDFLFARKACTNLKAPGVSQAMGLLAQIAMEGAPEPPVK